MQHFEYLPIGEVSKIRIVCEDYGSEGYCYMIHGTNDSGSLYTEEVWDYFDGERIKGIDDAIIAANAFADDYGLPREMVENPTR
jgi:hypothetical protein